MTVVAAVTLIVAVAVLAVVTTTVVVAVTMTAVVADSMTAVAAMAADKVRRNSVHRASSCKWQCNPAGEASGRLLSVPPDTCIFMLVSMVSVRWTCSGFIGAVR